MGGGAAIAARARKSTIFREVVYRNKKREILALARCAPKGATPQPSSG